MANIVTLTAADGSTVRFIDEVRASGGMKDVYFSPDKAYVVAFFRGGADAAMRERLAMITTVYRERIFSQVGGDYWKNLFCWPTTTVEHRGRLGVVAPFYAPEFFFTHGSRNNDMLAIRGREKEGKWFASPSNRNRFLDERELGDWMLQIKLCLQIARAVRRMHSAGLAHSDLSYRNVLIDPSSGRACLIDIDGLVVPGKFPPDVVGTPDFIAPECVATARLGRDDPRRKLPSIATDRHALAVLIYMYLLLRHPLRGDKVHDTDDPQRDEALSMGERALFVEHPEDASNRIRLANVKAVELPWRDTARLPCAVTGPYLGRLFADAFVDGLHAPALRPSADDWETALVKTVDLLQPCPNPACEQKWYVFDNRSRPRCPFCGTCYAGRLPVLNLYSSQNEGSFRPDGHRLMVYSGQSLFPWHANRLLVPNEKLEPPQRKRVGYFVLHEDAWYLVNEGMPELMVLPSRTPVAPGERIPLEDGGQFLMSRAPGGRLAVVQMANG
ncbi:kinase [Massilia oculi]|uniref:Kinase n=1 Tax=Massilia hydrophila TaxID=3044279 RepID=A0ABS7Y9H8_9BURK|nr:lipopolysaccharide kinase InaA family protein [Massilia oculi]MCA1855591.1 kinase [Massilia oculi]